MKNNLTTSDSIGWYECRFLRNPPDYRVVRWWDGNHLFSTPHYSNTTCDVREYTEFVALIPYQPTPRLIENPKQYEWMDKGEQLKANREGLDFSLKDVAQILGMDVDTIAKMERGEIEPDMTILERLL